MSKINVLPKYIANLIAAGEVVERPSSVVKELMENSIDAGATNITVEIKRGGITYIRITDNGCGIEREDVPNAFKSHATSKILNPDDLNSILTLGFRGEALASISAVSRTEILTRTQAEDIGTRCVVEGSDQILLDDAGCPIGTTIVVRDIFFNTPARMKFLKKDVTEGNSVSAVVDRLALSHPEVSFRFIRDGKEALLTHGNNDLKSTIYSVFGKDFSQGLIKTEYELNSIKVEGYISKPLAGRANRSMQFFFLNGRLVKSQTATAAIEQAYKNSMMVGKFPSCVLNILAPYESVDVNVHPAKMQVRFENEKRIFDAVYYSVKNAIEAKDTPAQVDLTKLQKRHENQFVTKQNAEQISFKSNNKEFWQRKTSQEISNSQQEAKEELNKTLSYVVSNAKVESPSVGYKTLKEDKVLNNNNAKDEVKITFAESTGNIDLTKQDNINSNSPVKFEEIVEQTQEVVQNEISNDITFEENTKTNIEIDIQVDDELQVTQEVEEIDFKVIGEVFKTYIIVELDKKILIIDKHAAHERMLFEQLKDNKKKSNTQLLLSPVTITLSKEEYSILMENQKLLSDAGFEIEDFGVGTILVRECPIELGSQDTRQMIEELAGYLLTSREPVVEQLDWIYHSTACRAAIKGGDNTSNYELVYFVNQLLSNPNIRYCPHGRPVYIEMTRNELEKQFGRI